MAGQSAKGADLRVGDDLLFCGKPHRITDFEPYSHPLVTKGETWRIAYSRTDATAREQWGMTIEPDGSYEIAPRPAKGA